MKAVNSTMKKAVEFLAVKYAKMACGTASANNFCQTKEPANLKAYFEKK